MIVHLIDGTYELFRHYFAMPSTKDAEGREVAAVRGVVASVLGMVGNGATHIAVATDHVVESFRNALWPGYKTSEGVPADLLSQFPLLEEVLAAAGFVVWPMIEFEADDALAAGAALAAQDARVEQVIICTPDKDLAQCVSGTRIVQLNRRTGEMRDEAGVIQKFGVTPRVHSRLPRPRRRLRRWLSRTAGWGAKSSAAVLAKFLHLESIPADSGDWKVNAASASALAATLVRERDRALLFRTLATLRTDIPLFANVDELHWKGPTPAFTAIAGRMDAAVTEKRKPSKRRSP